MSEKEHGELLRQIAEGQAQLIDKVGKLAQGQHGLGRERVDSLTEQVRELSAGQDSLREEMRKGFAEVNRNVQETSDKVRGLQ
ncbi:hypothetical protein [Gracilibacillus timonensis]|uniref:hypothetical protein n=1 Tax=Gracilibacillus timonensis TaxID=1816696 RepID=UPI0008267218|nr:hypothetical protein [Gracilibacillus timonensis]